MKNLLAKIGILVMLIAAALPFYLFGDQHQSVNAQGTNLLANGNFSGQYYGLPNNKGQAPLGWTVWAQGEPPISDVHQFSEEYRSAPASFTQRCGYLTCKAGIYQTVNGLTPGKVYRFSIYTFIWSCKNENANSCRTAEGRYADKDSGLKMRIGVNPKNGSDPNSADTLWGGYSQPWLAFGASTVDVRAEGSSLVVFTQWENAVAQQFIETWWDDASFVELADGEGSPINGAGTGGGTTPGSNQPTQAPVQQEVPFVQPQSARPDGSVVHVVRSGDTFSSIYVAYRSFTTREAIIALNGWGGAPGIIRIGDEIKILPPGSVDPTTGRLLNGGPAPTQGAGGGNNNGGGVPPRRQTQTAEAGGAQPQTTPIVEVTPAPTGGGSPIGPSVPRQNEDVEKGGSLLPGAAPHFYHQPVTFSRRNLRRSAEHQENAQGQICVQFFADSNSDLLQNAGEEGIEGGSFSLAKQDYTIESPDGKQCIELSAGKFTIEAIAPSGYGFISSPRLNVTLYPNQVVTAWFSVLAGESVPDTAPALNEAPLTAIDPVAVVAVTETEERSSVEIILDNAAYLMFGFAGVIGLLSFVVIWTYRR